MCVDVVEQVARGAVHLRRAAERVRVLHLVAPAVRLVDRRALEQPEDVRGRVALAPQRPERVDLREEARPRALQRLERERAGDVGGLREPARAHEAERAERGHELRAVDEREALLRLQRHRLEPDRGERLARREAARPSTERLALADERQREMRERREVAARADRAAARHVRQDAAVEALEQQLDGLDARARVALGERVRAQQHRRAHDLVRVRLADAARVAAQQAQLELLGQLLRDRPRDEAAEAGVDAVGVLARCRARRARRARARRASARAPSRRARPARRRPRPPRRPRA